MADVLELICLDCGRTNPADAKFCSQCGAALLRKFCAECGAANAAEAHFCHSCGAALPEPILPTATPAAADVPTLNEVVAPRAAADAAADAPGAAETSIDDGAAREDGSPALHPARRLPLRGLVALAALVLLVAAAVWALRPHEDVPARALDSAESGAGMPATEPAATSPPLPPGNVNERTESAAGAAPETRATDAGAPAPATPAAPVQGALETEQPPATTALPPPRVVREPRRPPSPSLPEPRATTPPPPQEPKPAQECTRQAYALGLCAPGATITGSQP